MVLGCSKHSCIDCINSITSSIQRHWENTSGKHARLETSVSALGFLMLLTPLENYSAYDDHCVAIARAANTAGQVAETSPYSTLAVPTPKASQPQIPDSPHQSTETLDLKSRFPISQP